MVIDFMDLNVDDEQNSVFDAESATSNSNSSVVNGDVGDATNSNDVSNEDTLSDNVFTFNFGILKVNGAAGGVADEEVVESRSGFVTRELFPVSGNKEPPCRSWSADLLPFVPQQQRQGGHQTKQLQQKPSTPQVKKGRRGPRSRSSEYRGVTFYRRTGRWESHIWDCGKQIYLGGFDTAHAAARAYDRAAIQFRGADADINFSLCDYEEDLKQMKHLSKVDFVHILRRQSNGSSRRNSKYRSVPVHDTGKWEAQLGQQQLLGKKFQDQAPIKCDNRKEPVTKFEPSSYESEVVSGSQIEDNHHDLDLNLGMSNNSLKAKTECQRNIVKYHPYDVQNRKIHKIDSSRTTNIPPTRPRPLTLQNMQLWPGVCSDSSPNSKEIKAKDRIVGVGSSNEPQKWAWQMQGQLIATPMAAASSGFSSPVTTGFSASHLSKPQGSSTALNLCFSSYRA